MNYGKWKARINNIGFKRTVEVWLWQERPDGGSDVIQGDMVVRVGIGESLPRPSFELFPEQLEALAEALNERGISPSRQYVEGKLEATERHLSDTRKLLKLK